MFVWQTGHIQPVYHSKKLQVLYERGVVGAHIGADYAAATGNFTPALTEESG